MSPRVTSDRGCLLSERLPCLFQLNSAGGFCLWLPEDCMGTGWETGTPLEVPRASPILASLPSLISFGLIILSEGSGVWQMNFCKLHLSLLHKLLVKTTVGYGGSTEQTASLGWLEVKVLSLLLSNHITPWQRTGLIPIACS